MGHMVVDARDMNTEEAEVRVLTLYKEGGRIRQDLGSNVESLRTLLSETFKAIMPVRTIPGNPAKRAAAN